MTARSPAPVQPGAAIAPQGLPGERGLAVASVVLGLGAVGWPLAWAPSWAFAVAGAGALAVLADAAPGWRRGTRLSRPGSRPGLAMTAVVAAITSCAWSRAGTAVLAVEGLLILGYLLAVDAPAGLIRPGRWVRSQVRVGVAAIVASGAVLGALALHPGRSASITVIGLAAVVVAYLLVLPRS
jgi:hypothetical protein